MNRTLEAVSFTTFVDKHRRDPLLGFRFRSEAQRQLFRHAHHAECYWRSGNSGGKTAGGAALGICLARGIEMLDGEPVPKLGVPNTGWVMTQSYKQQVDASQKAYLSWLGKWPHDVSYVAGKGKGYIETIYVSTSLCKHETGKSCETCSRIVFHCEESESSVGGRIDWAHADEPPAETVWREVRARRQAGKPFVRFITATPLDASRWGWLQDDFSGALVYASRHVTGSREMVGSPLNGRAEIRSSIYDNAALSSDDVQAFLVDFKGDPFLNARVRGDYVDASGSCPFDVTVLDRWQSRCKDGKMDRVIVQTQIDRPDGRVVVPVQVEGETWWPAEPNEKYLLIADPSSGIKARGHDPAGLAVFARRQPRLVARYNGFLAPHGLGNLASILAQRYNRALVDVDMGGGYGGPFLTGLGRYGNINHDTDPDKPGFVNQRLGFRITAANRGELIGAIQQALTEDSIIVLSNDVLFTLKNIVLAQRPGGGSRYQARAGRHDEDMTLLGRALYLLYTRPLKLKQRGLGDRIRKELGIRSPQPRAPQLRWA